MTIASLKQQNYSIRQIASMLQRGASTAKRKLSRNSEQGAYARAFAQQNCHQRRKQGQPARKLHTQSVLFGMVRTMLSPRWSPEQIALTLARLSPTGHELRVAHETIYNCIYAEPVGKLRKQLIATLRQADNKCKQRSNRQDRCGQILDLLSIHVSPAAVEDRQFPGHRDGDLIKGEFNARPWALWLNAPVDCSRWSSCLISSRPARTMCCRPSHTSCVSLLSPCARRSPTTKAKRWRCTSS